MPYAGRAERFTAAVQTPGAFLPHAREETPESRGMPFGGKPPKKLGFRRHLAGSKMPKETIEIPNPGTDL